MADRPPPYRIIVIVEQGSGRDDDSGRCHYREIPDGTAAAAAAEGRGRMTTTTRTMRTTTDEGGRPRRPAGEGPCGSYEGHRRCRREEDGYYYYRERASEGEGSRGGE